MKALVYTAPRTLELLDLEEPAPAPGDTLVHVAAVGICGSELHGIQTPGFRKPPLVMGHEFAGTTADGRRVAVNPIVACRACDLCLRGHSNLCRTRSVIGIHRAGGFAESVAVPEGNLYEIPQSMSFEKAAVIEPLANGLHAWRLAGDPSPARVGIIGAGTIGLVCLLVALDRGVTDVMVIDLSEERLDVAKRLGATTAGPELDGEFDLIFDAVGVGATHRASVAHLRPGGTTVWLGLIGAEASFDSQEFVRGEKKILGSFAYPEVDFGAAVRLAAKLDIDWTESFPLDRGVDIFMELMHGRTDIVKALLHP